MTKFITTQHIGDRDIDEVIERKRQIESKRRPHVGTLMNVYRSTINPRVVAFTFGAPPVLEESVRLALGLSVYRENIIVGHIPLRVVA